MFQELKFQLSTAILTILTLAAGVSAFINFQQQNRFRLPEDGVIWVDRQGSVEALYVKPASPGRNAGIHPGDRLVDIDGVKIERATDVARVLVRIGAWSRAKYRVQSRGVELTAMLVVAEQPLDRAMLYQYAVGTAYLLIGLVRLFPARQRAKGAALLYSLPGEFHLPVLPLHRPAQHLRQGDLFRQPGGGTAGAHGVPAFLPDVSRSRGPGSAGAARTVLLYVPAAADVPGIRGVQFRRHEDLRAADGTALDAGPRLDGGVDAALPAGRVWCCRPSTTGPRTRWSGSS